MRLGSKTALVLALASGLAATAATAQTPAPAAGATKHKAAKTRTKPARPASIQEACLWEVDVFCSRYGSGSNRVVACLSENQSNLSPECRGAVGGKGR